MPFRTIGDCTHPCDVSLPSFDGFGDCTTQNTADTATTTCYTKLIDPKICRSIVDTCSSTPSSSWTYSTRTSSTEKICQNGYKGLPVAYDGLISVKAHAGQADFYVCSGLSRNMVKEASKHLHAHCFGSYSYKMVEGVKMTFMTNTICRLSEDTCRKAEEMCTSLGGKTADNYSCTYNFDNTVDAYKGVFSGTPYRLYGNGYDWYRSFITDNYKLSVYKQIIGKTPMTIKMCIESTCRDVHRLKKGDRIAVYGGDYFWERNGAWDTGKGYIGRTKSFEASSWFTYGGAGSEGGTSAVISFEGAPGKEATSGINCCYDKKVHDTSEPDYILSHGSGPRHTFTIGRA
ncbi:hypothetical protein GQ42DRAFT_157129 [Ramicandelaber brevisporus]|nr:hypothetical protein GQ42DRAFT_157129 [Ramicandelaber brevisporus]